MKFLVIFAAFGATLVSGGQDMSPEMIAVFEKGVGICQPKYGLKDEELAQMMQHHLPTSEEGICFMGCIMKHLGILQDDNKFNIAVIMEMAKPLKETNPKMYEMLPQLCDACSAVVDVSMNECVSSRTLIACVPEKGKAMGVTSFPFFEE